MGFQGDYDIGHTDASLAVKYLKRIGEPISYQSVLNYIQNNFGISRYLRSEEDYKRAIYDVASQEKPAQPGIRTPSPAVQEIRNEAAPTSSNY